MAKQIQVDETASENSEVGRKRRVRKALREARQALQPGAFNALPAAQRNELMRTVLLALVEDKLRELNGTGASAQSAGKK